MANNIDIALKIAHYLRGHQDETGSLWDDHDQSLTPMNHYATTFYAVAALLLYEQTRNNDWLTSATKAIEAYLSLSSTNVGPDRGHKEFNDLALLHCLQITQRQPDTGTLAERIDDYVLSKIPDGWDKHSSMPNNWVSMRGVCCLIKNRLHPGDAGKNGRWIIDRYILRCQQSDNIFYDIPAIPGLRRGETPLTYHAKICAMLAMAYEYYPSLTLAQALIRGLDTLASFVAPDAETFYFGRTNNGLFGYASGVYAYARAATVVPMSKETRVRYRALAGQLLRYIYLWQKPDGHVAIVPNAEEEKRTGWDGYMHTTVYNAYASAILLLAGLVETNETPHIGTGICIFNDAGLVTFRTTNAFAAAATIGQSVDTSLGYGEARYKGETFYKIWKDGRDLIAPPEISDNSWADLSLNANDGTIWSCKGVYRNVLCNTSDSFMSLIGEGLMVKLPEGEKLKETRKTSLISSIKKFIEKHMPSELIWWIYRYAVVRKASGNSKVLKYYRAMLLDLKRKWLGNIYFIPSISLPGIIQCAITPPLLDCSSIVSFVTSAKDGSEKLMHRTVRSSKGSVPQVFLQLKNMEKSGGCWVVGICSWMENQVSIDRISTRDVLIDQQWTVRFKTSGIIIIGQ